MHGQESQLSGRSCIGAGEFKGLKARIRLWLANILVWLALAQLNLCQDDSEF